MGLLVAALIFLLTFCIFRIVSLKKKNAFFHREWSSASRHREIYYQSLLLIYAGSKNPITIAKSALDTVVNEVEDAHP